MTWNAELQQLCYAPLEEQRALRTGALPTASVPAPPARLQPGKAVVLSAGKGHSSWPDSAGNQSEVQITFALPTDGTMAMFGLVVMAAANPAASGSFFFVDYTPPLQSVSVTTTWPRTITVGAMTNRSAAAAAGVGKGYSCLDPGVVCANDTLQLTARDASTMRLLRGNATRLSPSSTRGKDHVGHVFSR